MRLKRLSTSMLIQYWNLSPRKQLVLLLGRNVKIAEETALEYKLKVEALEYEVTKLKAKYSKKAS